MNSRLAPTQHSATSRTRSSALPLADVPSRLHVDAAANDDTAKSRFESLKDPLWAMAIGMGVFFGLMAVFIAWG